MQRRHFLQLSSLTAAAISIAQFQGCNPDAGTVLSQPDVLSLVAEEQSLIKIGREYLRKTEETSAQALTRVLLEEVSGTNPEDIRLALENKAQADFAAGRTLILDGWVISVTEARQCALLVLNR